ncbi:hypothetical protein FOS14_22270 [Skermania sp. ID1734]|uniref:hypothetical protein n=1 Tax=Skermania sp. ID1734 TaxID=2597516 RepID=UPI00118101CB|nr:hypothetical protein [Skermania sp. ID1734]TSD93786.1 hypothetical protein FOS14_22270 [Skermania sp. ID1734]
MNAATKIAGFALGLAVIFGVAVGVGATLGPHGNETTRHTPNQPVTATSHPTSEHPAGLGH